MNQILSHQHIFLPVWTNGYQNERNIWSPDLLLHVQVTVIRTRYRSILEREQDDDDRDRLYRPHRFPQLPDDDAAHTPLSHRAVHRLRKKNARLSMIDDPRVNDPRFREKYMLN